MSTIRTVGTGLAMGALIAVFSPFLIMNTFAHCDTTSGPIIPEARAALEKGDVTPVLKWVKKENEAEIRATFKKAVAVRGGGPEAKELADHYFLETLIRLHRAGEGAPYTGIKDDPVEPIIAMADKALADGSVKEMTEKLSDHLAEVVRQKFDRVKEANAHKDESVEAGRAFVEAYVTYTHFVEGIHNSLMSAGAHHGQAAKPPAAHEH